jgi:hypothetical protein
MDQIYEVLVAGRAPEELPQECPQCASTKINTTWVDKHTEIITGYPDLLVMVPARQCVDCKFEFLDWQAEAIKDAALQEHIAKHRRAPVAKVAVGDAVESPLPQLPLPSELSDELSRLQGLVEQARDQVYSPRYKPLFEALLGLINLQRRQHNIPYGTIVTDAAKERV